MEYDSRQEVQESMDNVKTGGFIKELRKERDMTQKQLADLLHITVRAGS